jgi:hypothetical protein
MHHLRRARLLRRAPHVGRPPQLVGAECRAPAQPDVRRRRGDRGWRSLGHPDRHSSPHTHYLARRVAVHEVEAEFAEAMSPARAQAHEVVSRSLRACYRAFGARPSLALPVPTSQRPTSQVGSAAGQLRPSSQRTSPITSTFAPIEQLGPTVRHIRKCGRTYFRCDESLDLSMTSSTVCPTFSITSSILSLAWPTFSLASPGSSLDRVDRSPGS